MIASSTILSLRNVTLRFGDKTILNDLSVDFWDGHIHAVIGPNGAGKSTMAGAIMGLAGYTDIEGDIRFLGESLAGMSIDERARRGISLAWQEPARFEGISVRAFIGAAARDDSEARAREVLDQVGLAPESYLDRRVDKTLSGGERKRIELATILAMQPKVVLMDEPDSGIDVEALQRIFAAFRFLKENGTTVIAITHSLAVLRQTEHAFLLCCGRLVSQGSVEKIASYFERQCFSCGEPTIEKISEEALHAG
jgi:Fe-S cluster assembly ATP-binding protein